jgi:hypothetical protein
MDKLDQELHSRTKRLRVAQLLLILVILTGLGFLIIANYRLTTANNKLQSQNIQLIKEQKSTLDTLINLGKERSQQINNLQNHIDCIVTLFSKPNRLNLTITDITTCQLTSGTTGAVSNSPPKALQAPTPTPQSQPSPSSQSSSQPSSPPSQPSSSSTPHSPSLIKQIKNFLGL